ncbi:MAG: SagB/ThcOx family dehydrogenase, partial [Candidatus Thiodiazotropha sp.]
LDRSDEFYPDEAEQADMLLALHPTTEAPLSPVRELLQVTASGKWHGRANRIDPHHLYDWPVITEVTQATQRPAAANEQFELELWPTAIPAADHLLSQQAAQILFLQRRSAQAFDTSGGMTSPDFFRLLDRLLPRSDLPPWSAFVCQPRLHLVLFIHGVEGLAPGLYLLMRRRATLDNLKALLRDDLLYEPVDEAPAYLPFYRPARAKARKAAMQLSCHQAIAGDSAFSLCMLAEFETAIEQAPWRYNELLWEAGMIGQSLYLEAEAIGLRGTGIGCFFDDGVHELLGIQGKALQAVYHFTVGAPINDPRLATLPPYPD